MSKNSVRNKRKERIGIVVSDKMDKTITVQVNREALHPVYKRLVRTHSKFKVHDEKEAAHIGDMVKIEETRPISKTKRWRLVEVIKKTQADAHA